MYGALGRGQKKKRLGYLLFVISYQSFMIGPVEF
jgi:hypothetical protein